MKYWFFDGNDVRGPFSLKELIGNKSFSEMSLVCPENFSDDGDHWQTAGAFDDFKPFFARNTQSDDGMPTFEQEMDTLLKESSPLVFDETPSEGPALQIPKKPAKPGPIEDYFNRVKEEDLGDILGIPNPNENSDMDLAHALEKQLEKTDSTRVPKDEQESEVDEQTVAELKKANQTHHVATATEVFSPSSSTPDSASKAKPIQTAPLTKEEPSMPVVESPTMPVIVTAPSQISQNGDGKKSGNKEPSSARHKTTHKPPTLVPDPAQLRREKVEVNSIRARLKQTQEMKDFLRETQNNRLKQELRKQNRLMVMALTAVVIIGGLFLAFEFRTSASSPVNTPVPAPSVATQELLTEPIVPVIKTPANTPAAVHPPVAAVNAQTASQEQKALQIVKNHPLSGQRGTLESYLNRIYRSQLSQGYTGTWAAEPLYKNIYIVKYQLTKTRKEPIIYIFQADVAQGRVTGALNNISLDLVGKL